MRKVKNFRHIHKMIRNTSRMLYQCRMLYRKVRQTKNVPLSRLNALKKCSKRMKGRLIQRLTFKVEAESGKCERLKSVGTSKSSRLNENEKKVGWNKIKTTVSYLRHLCFSEEKKMRFSRGEVVFYRLKIKFKCCRKTTYNDMCYTEAGYSPL